MALWKTTLPVSDEDAKWVDSSMRRLVNLLGLMRVLKAPVVLATPEYFPDPYARSYGSARQVLDRTCRYLSVDPARVDLELFDDLTDGWRDSAPQWNLHGESGPAGLYGRGFRHTVEIRASLLEEPVALVSTMAHELCHVILLGGGLIDAGEPDMERFTDLATVFLGFGVCSGNACMRSRQWDSGASHGWRVDKLGYLNEELYGYALAVFAGMRGEHNPAWSKQLATNVRSYFKRSQKVLAQKATR